MIDFIKTEVQWLLHNVVGHPIAGVLWTASNVAEVLSNRLDEAGDMIHRVTCPDEDHDEEE